MERGHKVLEVGTGSGWSTALLAVGCGEDALVHSLDLQADLVARAQEHLSAAGLAGVHLKAGDGGLGWPEAAPFDRVIVTVGCPDVPPAWVGQLGEGGVLLVPLQTGGLGNPLLRLRRSGGAASGRLTGWSGFRSLEGVYRDASQDPQEMAGDPQAERLPMQAPVEVRLPHPLDVHLTFFLRLRRPSVRGLMQAGGALGFLPILVDRERDALFVPDPERPAVQVHGSTAAADWLVECCAGWDAAGRPKLTNYQVELVDPSASAVEGTWLDRRPHATLRLSVQG
ncbi:MAG: methyltransferase domain-containing protein [Candidatus Latescibacterota bacterium]